MLSLTSSSRLPASLSPALVFVRTKKTNKASRFPKEPRPLSYRPRIQKPRSPHDIRAPRPYAGAREPRPLEHSPFVPTTTSVPLENSHLRLHHSPPSSAPSYTTGAVPTVLQWLSGKSVVLSGEEQAPMKRTEHFTVSKNFVSSRDWSDELKAKIVKMRENGSSRTNIIRALRLPYSQRSAINIIAELPAPIVAARENKLEEFKDKTYNMRKRLRDEVRRRRREFW